MGRVTLSVCGLGLASCAQVFGIDTTSGPPDVALPPRATLTIDRVAFGATLETTPQPLTGLSATYYVEDPVDTSGLRRIAATMEGDVWTAEVPDGVPASVEFTLPATETPAPRRFYAFPNRDLRVQHGLYGRAGQQPAQDEAVFNVTLTLPSGYASGESFFLYAIGPWRSHVITSGLPAVDLGEVTIGPVTIPYSEATFGSSVGGSTLHAIGDADRVLALRYVGNDLTAAAELPPFAQTGSDSLIATLADVPHAPLDVTIEPAAIATRLAGTSPASTSIAMAWSVHAAPGYIYGNNAGPQLNAGGIDSALATTTITAGFGNPFTVTWHSLFTFGSHRARTHTPSALGLPVTLYAGLNESFEPAAGATVEGIAAVPVLMLVNSTPLPTDGLEVTIDPNRAVTLGLVADKACAVYQYNVHELVPNAAETALDLVPVLVAFGPATEITVPAGVFTTGKTYSIRGHCIAGGFSALASGDFSMRELPVGIGFLDSGVFTVAAP